MSAQWAAALVAVLYALGAACFAGLGLWIHGRGHALVVSDQHMNRPVLVIFLPLVFEIFLGPIYGTRSPGLLAALLLILVGGAFVYLVMSALVRTHWMPCSVLGVSREGYRQGVRAALDYLGLPYEIKAQEIWLKEPPVALAPPTFEWGSVPPPPPVHRVPPAQAHAIAQAMRAYYALQRAKPDWWGLFTTLFFSAWFLYQALDLAAKGIQ